MNEPVIVFAVVAVVIVVVFVALGMLFGAETEKRRRSGENLWGTPRYRDDEEKRR